MKRVRFQLWGYSKLSQTDQKLYDVITNTEKTAHVDTTTDLVRTDAEGNSKLVVLGAFNGQNGTESFNEVNMIQAQNLEANGGQSVATTIRHEIFEGAISTGMINGVNTNSNKHAPFTPRSLDSSNFGSSHSGAIGIDSKYQGIKSQNQLYYQIDTNNLWFNLDPKASSNSATGWFKIQ